MLFPRWLRLHSSRSAICASTLLSLNRNVGVAFIPHVDFVDFSHVSFADFSHARQSEQVPSALAQTKSSAKRASSFCTRLIEKFGRVNKFPLLSLNRKVGVAFIPHARQIASKLALHSLNRNVDFVFIPHAWKLEQAPLTGVLLSHVSFADFSHADFVDFSHARQNEQARSALA